MKSGNANWFLCCSCLVWSQRTSWSMQMATPNCATSAWQSSLYLTFKQLVQHLLPTMQAHPLQFHRLASLPKRRAPMSPRLHSLALWNTRHPNSSSSKSTVGCLTCGPLVACSTSSWSVSLHFSTSKATAETQLGAFSVSKRKQTAEFLVR